MTTETLGLVVDWIGSGSCLRRFVHSDSVHTKRTLSGVVGGQIGPRSNSQLSYSTDGGKSYNLWAAWSNTSDIVTYPTNPPDITIDVNSATEDIWIVLDNVDNWDETLDPKWTGKWRNPNPTDISVTVTLTAEIGGEINAGICKIEPLIGF